MEEELIRKALDMGADYCDIRTARVSGTSLELKDSQVEKAIFGESEGMGIRVLYNGAWGFYSTHDMSEASLLNALETAFKLAKATSQMGERKTGMADVPVVTDTVIWQPKKDPMSTGIKEKHELLRDMVTRAKEVQGIKTVSAGYADKTLYQRLVNTDGSDVRTQVTRTYVRASLVAKDGSNISSLVVSAGGTGGFEVFEQTGQDPIENAVEGAESAVRLLHAEKSPSGLMPVISDPDLTGVFAHEALGHATEADLVLAGDSCLEGMIGEMVGSEVVTIIDDPTRANVYGSFPYDDEGVKARKKVLVENGVLKTYLLSRETAFKLGMEPNGSARAESIAYRPLVRMSNTFIDNGDHSFEELVEDIKLGIYAKGSRGGQVDTGKGTFQFSAQEAFLIENGEITKPLKDVSFGGRTLEILKSIDAVGNDFRFGHPGSCGKGQWVPVSDGGPHIRIKEANVGGA